MIKAIRSRILVEMFPAIDDLPNKLNLTLIDKKKHYDHALRKGKVVSVGRLVSEVGVGDVIYFRGDAGQSLDGDPELDRPEYNDVKYRWLNPREVEAVEDSLPELVSQEAAR